MSKIKSLFTFIALGLFGALAHGADLSVYWGADTNNSMTAGDLSKGKYILKVGKVSIANEECGDYATYFETNSESAQWSTATLGLYYIAITDTTTGQTERYDLNPLFLLDNVPVYAGNSSVAIDSLRDILVESGLEYTATPPSTNSGNVLSSFSLSASMFNQSPYVADIENCYQYMAQDKVNHCVLNAEYKNPRIIFKDPDLRDRLFLRVHFEGLGYNSLAIVSNNASEATLNLDDIFSRDGAYSDILKQALHGYDSLSETENGLLVDKLTLCVDLGDVNPQQYDLCSFNSDFGNFKIPELDPILEGDLSFIDFYFYWVNSSPVISDLRYERTLSASGLVISVNFPFNVSDADLAFNDYIKNISATVYATKIVYTTNDGNTYTWVGKESVSVRLPTGSMYSSDGTPIGTSISIAASQISTLLRDKLGSGFFNVKSIDRVTFSSDSTISAFDSRGLEGKITFGDTFGGSLDVDGPFPVNTEHSCAISPVGGVVYAVSADANAAEFTLEGITVERCPLCDSLPKLADAFSFNGSSVYSMKDFAGNTITVRPDTIDDTISLWISVSNTSGIKESGNIGIPLRIMEDCGISATATQVISLAKHSKPLIGAVDQQITGNFRRDGDISFKVDPKISNVCARDEDCNSCAISVTATTDIPGVSAAYDAASGMIEVTGTLPDTDDYDDKDISMTLSITVRQDGRLHGESTKNISIGFHSEEKLTHTQPVVADKSLSVTYAAGTTPGNYIIQMTLTPCELCRLSNVTYLWNIASGSYASVVGAGVSATVSFASAPFETYAPGTYELSATVSCKQGEHTATGNAVLKLTVTAPDYPPMDFSTSPNSSKTSSAELIIVGPTIVTDFDEKSKIEQDAVLNGTFVTPVNTPTFIVDESNVDFGEHKVIINGAVRTGGTDAPVGRPLQLNYDASVIVPVGGDIGIIEAAK